MKTTHLNQKLGTLTLMHILRVMLTLCLILVCAGSVKTQTEKLGGIKVRLLESDSITPIPFANVVVYTQNGKQAGVGTTNMDGNCTIKIKAGVYDVKGVYVGFQAQTISKVRVTEGKTRHLRIILNSGEGVNLQEVSIVTYQIPLIDPDTKSGQTITREEYQNLATKDINSVAATTPGIFRKKNKRGRSTPNVQRDDNYAYPNETYQESPESKFKECKKDPLSTFSSDVDVASYANIRRILNQGQLPPKDAVRIEEMVNYFRYQYPQPKANEAFAVYNEISNCPWNKQHRLLQIGIQGRNIEFENAQANYLTFLIDVSGSMQSADKLPLLQDALSLLVKQLRNEDKVALVVYAGNAGVVLPLTSAENKQKIMEAIQHLNAGGSTAGGQGIELAYAVAKENFSKHANNRVILATDGDFNVGISDDESLVKLIEQKRDEGIFLTVLGFGNGNYKDAKMEKLADKGNGNYAYIDNLLEAKKVLVKEIGGTLLTIAKDVKIQIEFNPVYVKSYRLIGYDNRMLAHEDFKDDKKDAGDVGAGHSVTALYEIVPANSDETDNSVDELKYQKHALTSKAAGTEVCTVKLRYKEPKENKSKEIVRIVNDQKLDFENASANFKFCSAVVQLGLILRQSDYKGMANYTDLIRMAKEAKGSDEDGYQAEFIRMCEMAEVLASR